MELMTIMMNSRNRMSMARFLVSSFMVSSCDHVS